MTDPVTLILPADARFRELAPDVGGRYVVAAGGSEADAGVFAEAVKAAIASLADGAADDAGVELKFRTPAGAEGGIEVTVECEGKSSVVTHPLPAAKAKT
ncbi:MAG TPA: hypothetical protein VMZ90_08205 [Vicinamibacterales bacterium]|nr:hypothetical protein [Vicinamibacterales bacterium]